MRTAEVTSTEPGVEVLNDLVQPNFSPTLKGKKDDHLFWRGHPFRTLFRIESGALKTYTLDLNGNERVRGFHFPGELVGVDGIDSGTHHYSAIALEPFTFSRISLDTMITLASQDRAHSRGLIRWFSRQVLAANRLGGDFTAAERVAAFLLDMARITSDELIDNRLQLPMPRRDIGNYLRLATETVSRTIRDFSEQGLIVPRGRTIDLLDKERLEEIAEPVLSNE